MSIALVSAALLASNVVFAAAEGDLDAQLEALEKENAVLKKRVRIDDLEKENAALKKRLDNDSATKNQGQTIVGLSPSSEKTRPVPSEKPPIKPAKIEAHAAPSEGLGAISNALAYAPAARGPVVDVLVPVLPNWAGLYVGFHAGGGLGQWRMAEIYQSRSTSFCQTCTPQNQIFSFDATSATSLNPSGAVAGLQAGYLWNIGQILFGGEADLSASTIGQRDSQVRITTQTQFGSTFTNKNLAQAEASMRSLSSLRGKVGFAIDNWMFFGGAGLAIGYFDLWSQGFNLAESKYITGYTAGGGLNYAFGPHISLRTEYLYYGFPATTLMLELNQGFASGSSTTTASVGTSPSTHVIRAGLDWRIN